MAQKDELAKFRVEINAHASAINMLLITANMYVKMILTLEAQSHLLSSNATTLVGKKAENKLAKTDRKQESSSNEQLELLGDLQKKVDVYGIAVSRLAEGMCVNEEYLSIPEAANQQYEQTF